MIGVLLLVVTFWSSVEHGPEAAAFVVKTPAECIAQGEKLKALALKDSRVKSAEYHCLGVPASETKVSS